MTEITRLVTTGVGIRRARVLALAFAFAGAALPMTQLTTAQAGGGGCRAAPSSSASGVTVELSNFCFTPTILRVKRGDDVTFVNRDSVDHTVTGANLSFGSYDPVAVGQQVSYRFATNGVYPYFCFYHPGMSAAIVVGDGSGPGPTRPLSVAVVPVATRPAAVTVPATQSTPWSLLTALTLGGALVGFGAGRRLWRST